MPTAEDNKIDILGKQYTLLDELDNIPVADSFVRKNKLDGTRGHGEAKLYVGAIQKNNFNDFFEDFSGQAFFLKKDFEDYLEDAKFEYEQQEQKYRKDISESWDKYHQKLNDISDLELFKIERAVPQDTSRFYIQSERGNIFDYFRDIVLPIISYVSILKLKDEDGKTFFLFRLALSYSFNPYHHPAQVEKVEKEIEKKKLPKQEKEQLVKARIGQGAYREKLLLESSECIITRVNDERILIASHIKPWSVSADNEKIDPNNGLILTPTYDRLFDQGFITFQDDGTILISAYISPLNMKKLNLATGKKYVLPDSDKRREYLIYHRENIFKK